jgi:putative tryptophan/tyrosine transport system substrate-binding protein
MDRRIVLLATAASALLMPALMPITARAQRPPARLAVILSGTPVPDSGAGFRKAMLEVGLVEGKDYTMDGFWAEGRYDRFPELVDAALKLKPAVILVTTIASARAAQQATRTVPIVMTGLNDPVGSGLIASFASPGGNITGMATMNEDRAAKLIEFIREMMPAAKRLAVLVNPKNPSNAPIFQSIEKAAARSGMTALAFEASTQMEVSAAVPEIAKARGDAVIVGFDAAIGDAAAQLVELSQARKIPVVSTQTIYSNFGALMTYGVSPRYSMDHQLAQYVKKILAGIKPADLPVQRPTEFELVINTRTAAALNIKIPQSMLRRADRVIE